MVSMMTPGHVPSRERRLHGREVVEGHLHELVRPVGEEDLREAVVAGRDREAAVPVIALDDRDDLPSLGGVARRFQRDVGGFRTSRREDRVARPRRDRNQRLGERGTRDGGEPVIADVEVVERGPQRFDQLRIAMSEVVGSAVDVEVDQPPPIDVVDQVALPRAHDEVDAGVEPEPGLSGIPVAHRLVENLLLGGVLEQAVVEHRRIPR